jgi:hypothetical protein
MKSNKLTFAIALPLTLSMFSISAAELNVTAAQTGTKILWNGDSISHQGGDASVFFLALPKGKCDLLMSVSLKTTTLNNNMIPLASSVKVDGSVSEQKVCVPFMNSWPLGGNGTVVPILNHAFVTPKFQCATSINITDDSPFLRVWTAKTSGRLPSSGDDLSIDNIKIESAPFTQSYPPLNHLSVSYSCK